MRDVGSAAGGTPSYILSPSALPVGSEYSLEVYKPGLLVTGAASDAQ